MKALRLALIWLPIWLPLLALPFVFSERLDCEMSNWRKGYFWSDDFSSQVTVSGTEKMRRVDFTRVRGFKEICVVAMYTYGEPYGFPTIGGDFNYGGRRACWRDEPGKLTVAGLGDRGNPVWTQLSFKGSQDGYHMAGASCAEPAAAVLTCVNDVCDFAPPR